ncbi:MAG: polyprenyl synthetase family protein [Clostridiales bacterium]|nr:polyprenyl synthetase family protein [Clostridiales bacterium]
MTEGMKDKSSFVLGYEDAVAGTGEEVRRLLKEAPLVLRHMTSHLSKAAGKMIRARALLACAIRQDGSINPDAVKAAAAVELLHLATLVHDDIIDNADKRRGIDALHKRYGEKFAVLCGDWLFCTALEHVSTADTFQPKQDTADRSFTRYLTEVCLGEIRQNRNNYNYRLSEREYFRIIRGKTAALFEACFNAGFILSEEDAAIREVYLEIGSNIGLIFQLADDCADYEASPKVIKKPVLSDYSRGVVTLPLIYALKKDKALSEKIAAGLKPDALKAAVEEAGGLRYAHGKIDRLYKKTLKAINFLDIDIEKRELLLRLLKKAAGIPA